MLDFTYAYKMKEQFNGDIANLRTFGPDWGLEPDDTSYAMVTNHDLERNGSTLTYKDGDTYKLATYFMLSWPHGVPQVYDGFTFSNNDASPPADADGYVTDASCSEAWQCVHRDTGVAGMVGWRNAVGDAEVTGFQSPTANVIGFARGAAGFVALNNTGATHTSTFSVGLADGEYCNAIDDCATKVTVSGGQAELDIPAKGAIAFHTGS